MTESNQLPHGWMILTCGKNAQPQGACGNQTPHFKASGIKWKCSRCGAYTILDTPMAAPTRSQATNAYDLLEDVITLISKDPHLLDMRTVLSKAPYDISKISTRPQNCGTIGCIGGWITVLTGQSPGQEKFLPRLVLAQNVLDDYSGGMTRDIRRLFHTDFPPHHLDEGSPEYVAHVVKNIRAFMAKHENALKNRNIERFITK